MLSQLIGLLSAWQPELDGCCSPCLWKVKSMCVKSWHVTINCVSVGHSCLAGHIKKSSTWSLLFMEPVEWLKHLASHNSYNCWLMLILTWQLGQINSQFLEDLSQKSLCCHAHQWLGDLGWKWKEHEWNSCPNESHVLQLFLEVHTVTLTSGISALIFTTVWCPISTDGLPVISAVWVISEQSHREEHSLPILASPDWRSMRQISCFSGLNYQVV